MHAPTCRRHVSRPVSGSPVAPRSLASSAAVGELLGREVPLRRDHERLEQPLADRVAVEQVARLGPIGTSTPTVASRARESARSRDDDVLGPRRVTPRQAERPAAGVLVESRRPRPAGSRRRARRTASAKASSTACGRSK